MMPFSIRTNTRSRPSTLRATPARATVSASVPVLASTSPRAQACWAMRNRLTSVPDWPARGMAPQAKTTFASAGSVHSRVRTAARVATGIRLVRESPEPSASRRPPRGTRAARQQRDLVADGPRPGRRSAPSDGGLAEQELGVVVVARGQHGRDQRADRGRGTAGEPPPDGGCGRRRPHRRPDRVAGQIGGEQSAGGGRGIGAAVAGERQPLHPLDVTAQVARLPPAGRGGPGQHRGVDVDRDLGALLPLQRGRGVPGQGRQPAAGQAGVGPTPQVELVAFDGVLVHRGGQPVGGLHRVQHRVRGEHLLGRGGQSGASGVVAPLHRHAVRAVLGDLDDLAGQRRAQVATGPDRGGQARGDRGRDRGRRQRGLVAADRSPGPPPGWAPRGG